MENFKKVLYKILDLIMGGRGMKTHINDFSLRLPTRYFRWFPSDYEHDNYQFLKKYCNPNDIVMDIGAHIGLFSVCALQCAGPGGRVYSFEPTPSTFRLLQKTIKINNAAGKIFPFNAAVSGEKGTKLFFQGKGMANVGNSLISNEDITRMSYEVETTSLDAFVQENKLKVNFIKIDAEGAELNVLRGAQALLSYQKPICILGMHPRSILRCGGTNKEIWDIIQRHRYNIIYKDKSISQEDFCGTKNLFDVHLLPG